MARFGSVATATLLLCQCAHHDSATVYFGQRDWTVWHQTGKDGEPQHFRNALTGSLAFDPCRAELVLMTANGLRAQPLDGSRWRNLGDETEIWEIAIDARRGHLYRCQRHPTDTTRHRIVRCDLADGGNERLIVENIPSGKGIDIDPRRGKVYWTQVRASTDGPAGIWRANLDGSDKQPVAPARGTQHVAVDRRSGHVFWSEFGTEPGGSQIRTLDPNGDREPRSLVTGLANVIADIQVDAHGRRVYWAEFDIINGERRNARIRRCALDGSHLETFHAIPTGTNDFRCLAIGYAPGETGWLRGWVRCLAGCPYPAKGENIFSGQD